MCCFSWFKYKFIIDNLSYILDHTIENIRVVGGGANNSVLNQMCADTTGLEVRAGPTEATAAGYILGHLIAIDLLPSLRARHEIIEKSFETSHYYPMNSDPTEFDYPHFMDVLSKTISH